MARCARAVALAAALVALGAGAAPDPKARRLVLVAEHQKPMSAEPEEATLAVSKAAGAAATANASVAQVRNSSEENLAYVPLVRAQAGTAAGALESVKTLNDEAKAIMEETKAEARKAANEAALEYLAEVKKESAEKAKEAVKNREALAKAAEERAAKAAADAARPYHEFLLRGQKIIADYMTRAQELAAASNSLRGEGMKLAASANQYQFMGQTVQANQLMMHAHSLFQQGDAMKAEAEKLQGTATEVNAALPAYQLASQAAAASAEEEANPPGLDEDALLPY